MIPVMVKTRVFGHPGPMRTVTVRVHAILQARICRETIEEPIFPGTTVRDVLRRLDDRKVLGRGFVSRLLGLPRRPRILLDGLPLDLPAGLSTPLMGGENISILSTLAEI